MPGTGSGADGEEDFGDEVGADDDADAAEEGNHVGGDAVADEDGAGVGAEGSSGGIVQFPRLCRIMGCSLL